MIEYIIRQALLKDCKVDIIYMCDKGITERSIRPIKIENDIVEAYCYLKKSIRKFKLENILAANFTKTKKAG